MRYLDRLIRRVTFYSRKEWIFVGSCAAIMALIYVPWAYQYVADREQISGEGISTVGRVVSGTVMGERACQTRAEVRYGVRNWPVIPILRR